MHKLLSAICIILAFISANSVLADPPPTRPDDYVKTLSKQQWVFAETLWGDRNPCTPNSCMGGYYSPPLVLSVWFEKDSNDDKHSIEAVATIEGCSPLGTNLIWEKDYEGLSRDKRIAFVEGKVRSLTEKMAEVCKAKLADPVPLSPLDQFFPN